MSKAPETFESPEDIWRKSKGKERKQQVQRRAGVQHIQVIVLRPGLTAEPGRGWL